MTALLLQYAKLIMVFLLVGSVIGLSRFAGENRNGTQQQPLEASFGVR